MTLCLYPNLPLRYQGKSPFADMQTTMHLGGWTEFTKGGGGVAQRQTWNRCAVGRGKIVALPGPHSLVHHLNGHQA